LILTPSLSRLEAFPWDFVERCQRDFVLGLTEVILSALFLVLVIKNYQRVRLIQLSFLHFG
jgi:hypothetical protein